MLNLVILNANSEQTTKVSINIDQYIDMKLKYVYLSWLY